MSLINEALKKAQRLRTEAPGEPDGAGVAGRRPAQKRSGPMSVQTLIVLSAAAAALIVCSVVLTVHFLNPAPVTPVPTVASPVVKPALPEASGPSPIVVAPLPRPATAEPKSASPVEPAPEQPVVVVEPARPVVSRTETSAAPAPRPVPPGAPDPRILEFVDHIKVAGIRSSGSESKVLMNDRVYRVNDIVERALNVKLVKVESDSLTFTDASGTVYTKSF